jgi:topoisomerase-4 subunit A
LHRRHAQRYPLVDGQGNYGNIDGDNAAAMRYTEARLTEAAEALLEGIDEDAVDFRPTYDGEDREPVVLPAAFPNLLANGSQGIAVGMATSIPPHNAGEICEALLHLIKYPKATVAKLVELVPGPDFPTGGILVEPAESVVEAYRTGRGSFRLRARWMVEQLKGGTWRIVVTEIPYQVAKARLVEKIATLLQERKLTLLGDVNDESAAELRLVLEPKSRNVDPAILMESLFRLTDLEIRFGLNMNVVDAARTPRVMSLQEVLRAFLDHRRDVLNRRTRFRLGRIDRRLEVLGGYLIAYRNLDKIIKVIREEDEPKKVMMARWKLSDVQAEAILDMKLRALRKLEEATIREEFDELTAERKDLQRLLKDEGRQWQSIADELRLIKKRFGGATALGRRRTEIGQPPAPIDVPAEATVEREPVTIVLSEKGWIRALKGHVGADGDLKFKEGDRGRFAVHAETTDKLLVFGTNGRFYTLACDKLASGRGHGEPLRLMVDLPQDRDVAGIRVHRAGGMLLVASADGRGFVVKEEDALAQTRAGRQVLNLAEGVEAVTAVPAEGDHVAALGRNRKLLVFPLKDVPVMARGRGVILQKHKDGGLADVKVFRLADGLSWKSGENRTRTEMDLRAWIGARAQAGRLPPTGFPRANRFG